MNKTEFIKYIAEKHDIQQKEAKKVMDMFIDSVTDALREGNEVTLVGFGNFTVSSIEARAGRNPKTGEVIQIPSYKQVRFKVGQTLKNAVNNK